MAELSPALYRAGAGEPLVLIHGFTATWRCWLPVLGLLVPRFEVIAPTLHGHDGGPPSPPGAETLAQAADHFESLLDGLGVGTAHLAGNSLGGALALELAKRGRARSVVAISPGGGWRPDDRRELCLVRAGFMGAGRAVRGWWHRRRTGRHALGAASRRAPRCAQYRVRRGHYCGSALYAGA